jgi:twitching motility protein PilJ
MLIKQPIAMKPNISIIRNSSVWLKRFHNLPLRRKQTAALAACQLIPILGLSIGSTLVLTNSLRTQLRAQAQSEVAVVETNYNIKVDQIGFGSRGQSDNTTIIDAAKLHQRKEALSTNVQDQVKQILKNEVKARNIEYATLVGKDLQIVVNANADRAKETITESALVSLIQTAMKENRQLKASEIVSWDELQKEGAPLPEGIAPQEALIRYVVTPVKNSDTQEVIGALVFGEVSST